MMNPILKSRGRLAAYGAWVAFYAVLYALLFAAAFPVCSGFAWVDAFLVWALLCVGGIMIWNVMHYAVPDAAPVLKRFVTVAAVALVVGSIAGIEILVVRLWIPEASGDFLHGMPLRLFSLSLACASLVLWCRADASGQDTGEVSQTDAEIPSSPENIERITVRSGGKIKVIGVNEIEYIAAEGDYVAIVAGDGRWLKEQTMKYYEQNLPSEDFVRIHRSCIVAVRMIVRIERYGKSYSVALRNGEKLRVSAGGYKLLKETMKL